MFLYDIENRLLQDDNAKPYLDVIIGENTYLFLSITANLFNSFFQKTF